MWTVFAIITGVLAIMSYTKKGRRILVGDEEDF